MRFALLGSGSRGNGMVVEAGRTRILIDCGFSLKELLGRLGRLGLEAEQLDGVVVTHEHQDHIGGIGPLARRFRLPVWMTAGTWRSGRAGDIDVPNLFSSHHPFAVGDIELQPFPVPHDAKEPAQFVFGDGSLRLGLLTDTGRGTPHIVEQLTGVDGLVLECNHDAAMLEGGPYPPSLKQRVGGDQGHLSNAQAADILNALDHSRLQHLVAAHLSEKNNTPDHATAALAAVASCSPEWIAVADQEQGLDWRELR